MSLSEQCVRCKGSATLADSTISVRGRIRVISCHSGCGTYSEIRELGTNAARVLRWHEAEQEPKQDGRALPRKQNRKRNIDKEPDIRRIKFKYTRQARPLDATHYQEPSYYKRRDDGKTFRWSCEGWVLALDVWLRKSNKL